MDPGELLSNLHQARVLADERESKVKRDELVDQLIGSEAYVTHWTNKWADLLQVNSKFLAKEGASAFRNWGFHLST